MYTNRFPGLAESKDISFVALYCTVKKLPTCKKSAEFSAESGCNSKKLHKI